MGMKVLITGAGGYLGSVLAAQLANRKDVDCITGIVHNTWPRIPMPYKVSLVKMDMRSPELSEVMAGHDFVIHSAFLVHWHAGMSAAERDDINFNGTRNVAMAAVQNHIRAFLYASSVAAYDPVQLQGRENANEECPIGSGKSGMYYCDSKAVSEGIISEVLDDSGIRAAFFRICYITGPCDYATVSSFRQNAALIPGHDPRLQFVHEDDVVQAFARGMSSDLSGAFNVVPDDYIHLKEMFQLIGVRPPTVPAWLARLVTFVRWRYFKWPTHPSWVQTALLDLCVSNAKLKATGWTPRYCSDEALRTAV